MGVDKIMQSTIKNVIRIEIEGLEKLEKSIGLEYEQAVRMIMETKGKTIITGIGKSGHIGKKIAATFSSLGIPSFFVHPTEANHGDLGMINSQDLLIAISNSGNTAELFPMLEYAKANNINIIAITAGKKSTLASAGDAVLLLPEAKEACILGLAPTTSTTMSLAIGDSLAVAVVEAKGFSKNDFKQFHPGGTLGNQMLKIKDIMNTGNLPLVTLDNNTKMEEIIICATNVGFGCVGIVQNEKLVGVITDGDIRRNIKNIMEKKVEEVMTKSFISLDKDFFVSKALGMLKSQKISNAFILEDGKPIGFVHMLDILRLGLS